MADTADMPLREFEDRLREAELQSLHDYRKGTAAVPLIYRASGVYKGAGDGKDARLSIFIASDEEPDRHGDVVKVDGWDLSNFKRNPVLMFVHDYSLPPIGTVPKVWVEGKQLLNTVAWDESDPQAMYIKGKYDRGIMRAESVGFRALEFADSGSPNGGITFSKQELIEISAVPVPMHPAALQKALSTKRYWSLPTESELDRFDPVVKGAVPYKSTPAAAQDAAWDGPAEVSAASVEDLKIMAAWVDSAAPDIKGSYKLPHHKAAVGHSVVYKAVTSAIGVLNGGRGGANIPDADRQAVYNHLARHLRDEFNVADADVPALKAMDEPGTARQDQATAMEAVRTAMQGALDALDALAQAIAADDASPNAELPPAKAAEPVQDVIDLDAAIKALRAARA